MSQQVNLPSVEDQNALWEYVMVVLGCPGPSFVGTTQSGSQDETVPLPSRGFLYDFTDAASSSSESTFLTLSTDFGLQELELRSFSSSNETASSSSLSSSSSSSSSSFSSSSSSSLSSSSSSSLSSSSSDLPFRSTSAAIHGVPSALVMWEPKMKMSSQPPTTVRRLDETTSMDYQRSRNMFFWAAQQLQTPFNVPLPLTAVNPTYSLPSSTDHQAKREHAHAQAVSMVPAGDVARGLSDQPYFAKRLSKCLGLLELALSGKSDLTRPLCNTVHEILVMLHSRDAYFAVDGCVDAIGFLKPGNLPQGDEQGVFLIKMRMQDVALFPWEASRKDGRLSKWTPSTRRHVKVGQKAFMLQSSVQNASKFSELVSDPPSYPASSALKDESNEEGVRELCLGLLLRSHKNPVKASNARKGRKKVDDSSRDSASSADTPSAADTHHGCSTTDVTDSLQDASESPSDHTCGTNDTQ